MEINPTTWKTLPQTPVEKYSKNGTDKYPFPFVFYRDYTPFDKLSKHLFLRTGTMIFCKKHIFFESRFQCENAPVPISPKNPHSFSVNATSDGKYASTVYVNFRSDTRRQRTIASPFLPDSLHGGQKKLFYAYARGHICDM